ncbi:MAG: alpha/beta fold hydrolase [Deltaproteobacteria bacterium]|nr:alpha/beta fold hydrolase [Deltaproteobacteria bacterium]
MRAEKVTFPGAEGLALAGRLELPDRGAPAAGAVFAHCFTCNKNFKAAYFLSRALTREGVAVLRFDFPGLGESEGEFPGTRFTSNVRDVVAASRYLEARLGCPQILIGHSLGGAAVLLAAAQLPAVVAVATLAAPFEPGRLPLEWIRAREAAEARGEPDVEIEAAGTLVRLERAFFDDLEAVRLEPAIQELGRPLLLFHAPEDRVVTIADGERLFAAAQQPKSFFCLEGADHLLSRDEDAAYVGAVIGAWVRRHAPAPPAERAERRVLARIGSGHYRTELVARGHALVADEPAEEGGTGLGPTPYDLLLTALGACTCMTLRMYADRKGWPVEGIEVRLTHGEVHAQDCAGCETQTGMVSLIEREIGLTGTLNDEQRQRLVAIADRCPVHRTLTSEIRIETTLTEPAEAPVRRPAD